MPVGYYSQDVIDDLIYKSDIVSLINEHVPLKKQGAHYTACCPFHQEKTPSFNVNPQKQFYYCFGCHASGNVISFLMEYHKLTFPESIEALAKKVGTVLPISPPFSLSAHQASEQKNSHVKHLLKHTEKANVHFQQTLQSLAGKRALHYLHRRGIDSELSSFFQLGFSHPNWDELKQHQFSNNPDTGVETGLLIKKSAEHYYDRFRNRLMFPIRDRKGNTVGFGGRALDDSKPKYLNSPETPLFQKQSLLYGLFEALSKHTYSANDLLPEAFVVVEGYMDVIAMVKFGFIQTVATLGTSTSEDHIKQLFRHTQKIIFCFDGDDAGKKAAARALSATLPLMQAGREASFVFLPKDQDPDSLLNRHGSDTMLQHLKQAPPLSEFLKTLLSQNVNLMSPEGKSQFIKNALHLLHKITDPLFRQLTIEDLADHAHIRPSLLTEPDSLLFNKNHQHNQKQSPSKNSAWSHSVHQPPFKGSRPFHQPLNQNSQALMDQLIIMLLNHPEVFRDIEISPYILDSEMPHLTLFLKIKQFFKANPETSLAYLLGQWHATEEGGQLAAIAANTDQLKKGSQYLECEDALLQLEKLAIDTQLAKETHKTKPDHRRIQELIQKKATFSI